MQWRIQDFPDGGAPTPEGGAPTYYLTNFSQKLHENEENLTQRGGRASLRPPPRSANAVDIWFVSVGNMWQITSNNSNHVWSNSAPRLDINVIRNSEMFEGSFKGSFNSTLVSLHRCHCIYSGSFNLCRKLVP